MTDIEKLAAAFEKQSSRLGPFAHELRAGTIKRAMRDLILTIDAAVGLVEGTHVVISVERLIAMHVVLIAKGDSDDMVMGAWHELYGIYYDIYPDADPYIPWENWQEQINKALLKSAKKENSNDT